jgi:hypothetical protein
MVFFVPSIILGIAQALTAVGAVVGGVILSQSQKSSSSSSKASTPTPSPSPGPKPTGPTQQYTVPATLPSPTFNRGNFGTTTVSSSGPGPSASIPAAPVIPDPPAPPQAPEPPPPPPPPEPPTFKAVKAAPIDTVLFVDEAFSKEFITDLLFEDVGGQELLSIARDDTVNGQDVIYQPIKNLGILRDTYDINNLLKLQETSDRFFANFLINLFEKIPRVGNGPDGKNYYFDEVTGDGIIEFVNIRNDEQVEVQISNAGIIEEVGI